MCDEQHVAGGGLVRGFTDDGCMEACTDVGDKAIEAGGDLFGGSVEGAILAMAGVDARRV